MDGSMMDLAKYRLSRAKDDLEVSRRLFFFIASRKEAEKQLQHAESIVSMAEAFLMRE